MRIDPYQLQMQAEACLNIAQFVLPKDTTNLAYNGTKKYVWSSQFAIVMGGNEAPYLDFLEYGTRYSTKHVDVVQDKIFNRFVRFLESELNQQKRYAGRIQRLSLDPVYQRDQITGQTEIDFDFLETRQGKMEQSMRGAEALFSKYQY